MRTRAFWHGRCTIARGEESTESLTLLVHRFALCLARTVPLRERCFVLGVQVSIRVERLFEDLIRVGRESCHLYFWHRSSDPYVIFIAEYFLRRSNRTTVSRYLPGFLEALPTAASIIAADPDDVVNHARWAGFTSRTRALPDVVAKLTAMTHIDYESLCELPYIGPYAAQAYLLYVKREPAFPVDGNVERVVSRYLEVGREELRTAINAITSSAIASSAVEGIRHAHIGALTVGWESCRPQPRCQSCPLRVECAFASLVAASS